jgi:hypothetical protein
MISSIIFIAIVVTCIIIYGRKKSKTPEETKIASRRRFEKEYPFISSIDSLGTSWNCPSCGTNNAGGWTECSFCNKPKIIK